MFMKVPDTCLIVCLNIQKPEKLVHFYEYLRSPEDTQLSIAGASTRSIRQPIQYAAIVHLHYYLLVEYFIYCSTK